MGAIVDVPERVRRKALALGAEGERWLADLGQTVADLEAEWSLRVGTAITGGSSGYVANARTTDGTDAVLKIAIHDGLEGNSPFATELHTLLLGDGYGYVTVLRADEDRRAIVQERLGRSLDTLGLPVEAQIEVIAALVSRAWHRVPETTPLRTGAEQAQSLGEDVRRSWEALDRPCPLPTIVRAERYARSRREAFDASACVLIHGDAHPANILEDPRSVESSVRFKLIDPDGMRSEPAHDLAIPLRDWTSELLGSDRDSVELGLAWCTQLAERTGVDAQAIWEWAFVERVSTGLFLIQLGEMRGRQFLEVATHWADAHPDR